MIKNWIGALALTVLVWAAGYFYIASHPYYPVVRLAMPGRLNITAILPTTNQSSACLAAADRFAGPITQQCKECKATKICDRQLQGLELAIYEGRPVPHPMVVAQDLKIAVFGPLDIAAAGCKQLAADLASKGLKSATCIPAQPS